MTNNPPIPDAELAVELFNAEARLEKAAEVIEACRVALERLEDLATDWANASSSAAHPQSGYYESRIEREARAEFERTRKDALTAIAEWEAARK